jgi:uracil-DNA glycosylase
MSKMSDKTGASTGRAVVQTLESLERAGITHLPKKRSRAARTVPGAQDVPPMAVVGVTEPQTTISGTATAIPAPSIRNLTVAERVAALEIIRAEVAGCQRCAELAATRCKTVFGSGTPQPRLVFMGEAPGADEDRQGEPFVGRAGQLLTKIIEACTLRREDVYILNTLKCRPPENRTPLPQEAANCREFLDRQLAILRPEYICCLGAVAAQNLLGTTQTIGRLRGSLHAFQGFHVLCTYHPAYLLRNPAAKKDCWQDMQLLLREMGIPLPGVASQS